jgi:hypothetical protein
MDGIRARTPPSGTCYRWEVSVLLVRFSKMDETNKPARAVAFSSGIWISNAQTLRKEV